MGKSLKNSWGKGKWKYHLDISLEVTVCAHMCVCMYMCICVCTCMCMYMCVYVHVYNMCVTADNVCDVRMTLLYFQSICDAN